MCQSIDCWSAVSRCSSRFFNNRIAMCRVWVFVLSSVHVHQQAAVKGDCPKNIILKLSHAIQKYNCIHIFLLCQVCAWLVSGRLFKNYSSNKFKLRVVYLFVECVFSTWIIDFWNNEKQTMRMCDFFKFCLKNTLNCGRFAWMLSLCW